MKILLSSFSFILSIFFHFSFLNSLIQQDKSNLIVNIGQNKKTRTFVNIYIYMYIHDGLLPSCVTKQKMISSKYIVMLLQTCIYKQRLI